jgi:hypothetical protein
MMASHQTIGVAEIAGLIDKIKDGATGNQIPRSEVLRLCLPSSTDINLKKNFQTIEYKTPKL